MRPSCISIRLENYRSFELGELELGQITAIVGANSAGKSNLVDAFRFLSESLTPGVGLPVALERRGGFEMVVHKVSQRGGRPRNIRLTIGIQLSALEQRWYSIYLEASKGSYQVKHEVLARDWQLQYPIFESRRGRATTVPEGLAPKIPAERLTLPAIADHPDIAPSYGFLTGMQACAIATDRLREYEDPDSGDRLEPNGQNAAFVLEQLAEDDLHELIEVLGKVVPGITGVRSSRRGTKRTILFKRRTSPDNEVEFEALQMSEGTLRLFGVLLALFQASRPTVLTIEEPEVALHFAAAHAMVETFAEYTGGQLVFTTHDPDLMDVIDPDDVRVVREADGASIVQPLAKHTLATIRKDLVSPGELMRRNALYADGQAVGVPPQRLAGS